MSTIAYRNYPLQLSWRFLWACMILTLSVLVNVSVAAAVINLKNKRVEESFSKEDKMGTMDTSGMDVVTTSNIADDSYLSPYAHLTPMLTINNNPFEAGVRRLFSIGDVHGCINELNDLIAEIKYDHEQGDRIILQGDLVNKGPDSVGVIRRAKELKAWCVRGNHDDVTLRMMAYLRENNIPAFIQSNNTIPEESATDPITLSDEHISIVRNMTTQDYHYLNSCPLVLGIPALNSLFVHGGVDPKISLEEQVPYLVMNMRSIQEDGTPTPERTPVNWADEWNQYQETQVSAVEAPYTDVYYGHDSILGLQIKTHTFGLDSGCVFGGQLTALELKSRTITQVQCKSYTEHPSS